MDCLCDGFFLNGASLLEKQNKFANDVLLKQIV